MTPGSQSPEITRVAISFLPPTPTQHSQFFITTSYWWSLSPVLYCTVLCIVLYCTGGHCLMPSWLSDDREDRHEYGASYEDDIGQTVPVPVEGGMVEDIVHLQISCPPLLPMDWI